MRLYPERHRKKSLFVLLLGILPSRFRPPPFRSSILFRACCSTCTMRTLELCVFTLWLCLHVSVHAFQHITFRDAYPFADSEMAEVSDRVIFPGKGKFRLAFFSPHSSISSTVKHFRPRPKPTNEQSKASGYILLMNRII